MSASAWWWSAAAILRSTWPPWRAVSAIFRTPSRPIPNMPSPGAWRTMSPIFPPSKEEVTLTSIFNIDKMQANKHEIEQALAEGIHIRGSLAPIGIVRDASGRATALRVSQCEAKMAGGKLELRNIEGTEQDIEADLIVSAIGQAVDFTGLEQFNNGKGAV